MSGCVYLFLFILFYFIEYSLTGLRNSINANLGALLSSGRKTEQKVSLNFQRVQDAAQMGKKEKEEKESIKWITSSYHERHK